MRFRYPVVKSLALVAPVLVLAGCASANKPITFGLDESRASVVRQTCSDIMGLQVSAEYYACGGSLAPYVEALQRDASFAQAEKACEAKGLAAGSTENPKCALMQRSAAAPAAASGSFMTASFRPAELPAKHYMHMNGLEQQQRAELSCTQIGLNPARGNFGACVHSLNYAIANVKNWPGP